MKQFLLKTWLTMLCLLVFGSGTMWGETKTGSWDLTSSSSDWTASLNETYFSQPYGYKKANGTLTNKSISDFSTTGISQIKVGFKCLQNGETTSKLTIYLVDKDGKTLGNGVVVTPDNKSAASQTTYKYATFTTNLTGATGFMMKVTTFGKNILINGAEYEVTYTSGGGSTPDPEPTNYTVTVANNIANGTVTASPTSAIEGTEVTLTATPSTGYEFGSWNVTNATTSAAITVTDNKFTMPAANVNVSATFNAIPTHEAKFFVNGQQYGETQSVAEGSAITFPANKPDDIDDKKFVGWAEATISGTTNTAPALVSSKNMGNADASFYAVFATQEGEGNESLAKITDVNQVEEGAYAIITYNGAYYLSNAKATSLIPTTSVTMEGDDISIVDAMKWTLSFDSNGNYILKSNASTVEEELYLWGAPTNDGIRILTTSPKTNPFNTWQLKSTNDYGLVLCHLVSGTTYRYLSTYGTQDWRNYESTSNTNLAANLYKVNSGNTYSDYCTSVSTKTLSSIAVKTAPTTTTYFEGQKFNPAGLVITATYDDTTTEDIAYSSNESKFTFAPTLATALKISDVNVQITYGGQNCNQAITVNAKKNTSIEFSCEGNTGNGTAETPFAFTIGEDNTFPTAIVKSGDTTVDGATVAYSTTNTAYIDVNASTGALTLKKYASKSNNVRVTVRYADNEEYNASEATYYLTISKGVPVISFAEPTLNVAKDAENAGLAAIVEAKYGALTITYTSSNPAVADFDNPNSPILTLKKVGTATITAQSESNDAWNKSEKVTYALTVTRVIPQAGTTYNLVTASHPENLVDGVYIVAVNDNGTYKAMTSNLNDGYLDAVTVNVSNNSITDLNGAAEWTVRVDDSGMYPAISFFNGSQYLYNYNGTFTYSSKEENYPYIIDGGFLYADSWQNWFGYADGFMLSNNWDNQANVLLFKKTTNSLNILNLDENDEVNPNANDYYDGVVVARTLKADTWNSFCVPFAMSADDIAENFGDDAEVKTLDGLTVNGENYNLKFVEATSIAAGKPYMVRVKNAISEIAIYDTENMIEVDTRAASFSCGISEDLEHSVDFHGNFTKQLAPRDSYIISSNNFYFVDSDVNLKGFRGYFTVESTTESNKAVKLNFSFDDILTGIEGVTVEGLDNNIFDLQGRRVTNAKSGMYIMNGKKVIR